MTETMKQMPQEIYEASKNEVKNQLRQVRHAHLRCQVLCARAERYREMAMQATGRMDAVRSFGTAKTSKVESYVLELLEVHDELQKEIAQLMKQSREAEKMIALVENDRIRAVLQLRYLCAMDWQEIADQMHFTLRWIHKLHNQGIAMLTANRNGQH